MNIFFKAFIYLLVYAGLHFGYELTNWSILIPFFGTNESIFQHLKLAFWAYLIASIIEYFVSKDRYERDFWYTRIFSTVIVPWFVILIWYILPALIGHLEPLWLELSWSFLVTYISGLFGSIIERGRHNYSYNFKILVFVLFLISIFFFIRFSYGNPYIDVFKIPEV